MGRGRSRVGVAVVVAVALVASLVSVVFVLTSRGTERMEVMAGAASGWHAIDPAWLEDLDDMTLAPAEVSVGGAVFLGVLAIGLGVVRWRAGSGAE